MSDTKLGPLFVCHSSKDAGFANDLVKRLEAEDQRCWIAPRNITPGAKYGKAILDGIEHACAVLVLLTEDSADSPFCALEIERSVSYRRPMVVAAIDGVGLPRELEFFLSRRQWIQAERHDAEKIIREVQRALPGIAKPPFERPETPDAEAADAQAADKLDDARRKREARAAAGPVTTKPSDGSVDEAPKPDDVDDRPEAQIPARVLLGVAAVLVALLAYAFFGGAPDGDKDKGGPKLERAAIQAIQSSLRWCGDCLHAYVGWPSHGCTLSEVAAEPVAFPFEQTLSDTALVRTVTQSLAVAANKPQGGLAKIAKRARAAGQGELADGLVAYDQQLRALRARMQDIVALHADLPGDDGLVADGYRQVVVIALHGTFWRLHRRVLDGVALARDLPNLLPADIEAELLRVNVCDPAVVRDSGSLQRYRSGIDRELARARTMRSTVEGNLDLPPGDRARVRKLLRDP